MRAFLLLLPLLVSALFLASGADAATPEAGQDQTTVYLPSLRRAPAAVDCRVAGSSYSTLSVSGPPTDRPAAQHPDLNLTIRGWRESSGARRLIEYGPSDDPRAPQFDTLFGNRRLPAFTGGWDVYGWNWETMTAVDKPRAWDLTLLGMGVAKGEIIRTPDSGYDIGAGYDALVLYASPTQLTLKYTREDNVVYGYTIHLEQICVEPSLLALYQQTNASGRRVLPAVRGGQPLGRAASTEIQAAIRDNGSFMDPRAHNDWWRNH